MGLGSVATRWLFRNKKAPPFGSASLRYSFYFKYLNWLRG